MKQTLNRAEIEKLPVDLLGFIFYERSKRYIGKEPDQGLLHASKPRVAVFVDESIFEILGLVKNFGFEYVQLHGKENPKTCRIIKEQGIRVIKAFNLHDAFDFSQVTPYETTVDYLLFDTRSELPGGSGTKFSWDILQNYQGKTPFFLSGGIGPDDAESITKINHPKFCGVDLNSGFEDAPGVKNRLKLKKFIAEINPL